MDPSGASLPGWQADTMEMAGVQSLRLVGADCVSLALPLRDGAKLAHAVAPPLPTKPACAGLWRGPHHAGPPPSLREALGLAVTGIQAPSGKRLHQAGKPEPSRGEGRSSPLFCPKKHKKRALPKQSPLKWFSYLWSTEYMCLMSSRTLLEYPISLSYQDTTFTKVSVRAIPALASKMEVRESPRKSLDTTSSSV